MLPVSQSIRRARALNSFDIHSNILRTLRAAGFETTEDLGDLDAAKLAAETGLSLNECEEVLLITNPRKRRRLAATQVVPPSSNVATDTFSIPSSDPVATHQDIVPGLAATQLPSSIGSNSLFLTQTASAMLFSSVNAKAFSVSEPINALLRDRSQRFGTSVGASSSSPQMNQLRSPRSGRSDGPSRMKPLQITSREDEGDLEGDDPLSSNHEASDLDYNAIRTTSTAASRSSGLRQGCILEVSGVPGTPKERIAIMAVRSVLRSDEEEKVLFIDIANMTHSSILIRDLQDIPNGDSRVQYAKCHEVDEFMAMLDRLPAYLEQNPKTVLIVLNTLSFLFQYDSNTSFNERSQSLASVKRHLVQLCMGHNVAILITSQMRVKMVDQSPSPENLNTGRLAVVVPHLDNYLPSGRSYRVVLIGETNMRGWARLIASPEHPNGPSELTQVPYEVSPEFWVMSPED